MAGVAPQRGSNGTMIGMVVSIVVALILAGVLIWLVNLQEQLRADAASATAARNKIARGNDENEIKRLFPNVQAGQNKTLVGEIMRSGKALMGRITGDQNDSAQTALAKLDAAIARIAGDRTDDNAASLAASSGAVALIEKLYEQYSSERDARIQADKSSEKALKSLAEAQEQIKQLRDTFDDRLAKLTAQVEELQRAKSDFEEVKGAEVRALASKVEATRSELEDAKVTHARQKRQIAATLKEQDEMLLAQAGAIKEYRGNVPTNAEPLAVARKPLGKVLRILPGDSLCYINLGRDDNVALGMTFSVYSSDERVPASGRGKASLEVRSVDARTAECRVVSPASPDDPILEGDSVNNIVISKNRNKKQRFVVVGEFDTDFDGEPDVRGREQVIALIERWGGVVTDEVTAATDYLVVGTPPRGEDVVPTEAAASTPAAATADESGDEETAEEAVGTSDDEDSSDEADSDDDDDSSDDEDTSDDDDADGGNGGIGAMQDGPAGIQRKPEVDPTIPVLKRRYANEAERFRDARRRATYFSVPVLTQEQFYNFIGIEGKLSDIRRLQG
ncbi:MAG: hypothetical protein KF841_06535 [Phycisphaerae bacterium]|nr:hypothetical protein [Phycisphaerae bacterium]